jgi:hypothetical protein
VSKYLPSIWVGQSETPPLRQEAPDISWEAPDNLQETPDDLQETPDDLQETLDNPQDAIQVVNIMTKYSWRDLSFDEDANTHLLDHFCRRVTSDKDPSKPVRSTLLQLLLKNMVTSGELVIDRIEEGIPILSRGHVAHVNRDVMANVTPASAQETDLTFKSQSQLQPCHRQTPTQLAQAGVKLSKMALDKATRTAQERLQEEAQKVERKKQEVTADSNKLKKEARYKASMDKLGRLPGCPMLCRGKKCTGTPCWEEEPGFPYSHIDDMVVCTEKAHVSMATRAGCLMFHQRPKRSPEPPQAPPAEPLAGCPKNLGGEPWAQGKPPLRNVTQERGTGPSALSSLKGISSNSSSSATWTTGGWSRG